jgi:nucleoside-diphosphate-sugar epimerase
MSKPVILIAGATGFIGRNMAEYFVEKGYKVTGTYHKSAPFDLDGLDWIQADLRISEDVYRVLKGADVLIQAAATTSGVRDILNQPQIHVTDNAVMNSYMFRAAHELGIKRVIFFSCAVMLKPKESGVTEADFDEGADIHPNYFGAGWTKVYLEKIAQFYSRLGKTSYTVIRHSNVYGPHDKFDLQRSHVFGATITKVLTAEDKVTIWGSGEEIRDLLYVSDLTNFVERAILKQKEPFGLYHCGSGVPISINELVRDIIKYSGRNLQVEHDLSKPTITTGVFLDCSKALLDLGWKMETPLGEGIIKTIKWWRENMAPTKL